MIEFRQVLPDYLDTETGSIVTSQGQVINETKSAQTETPAPVPEQVTPDQPQAAAEAPKEIPDQTPTETPSAVPEATPAPSAPEFSHPFKKEVDQLIASGRPLDKVLRAIDKHPDIQNKQELKNYAQSI